MMAAAAVDAEREAARPGLHRVEDGGAVVARRPRRQRRLDFDPFDVRAEEVTRCLDLAGELLADRRVDGAAAAADAEVRAMK